MTATTWRALAGQRVTVASASGAVTGILTGVPTESAVIVQDPSTWIERRYDEVTCVELNLLTCARCSASVNKLFDGDICATCYRADAEKRRHAEPFPPTPCDKCGKKPAFRNPKGIDNRDLLCLSCHAERGDLPKDYGIITRSFPAAVCVGSDIDSPKHKWVKIKAGRWRCEGFGCNADRYSPPTWDS